VSRPDPSPRQTLTALVIAGSAYASLSTTTVPIIPVLSRELDVSASTAGFLLTGQLLASAVLTPLLGRIGDLRGRRRVYLLGMIGMVIGTVMTSIGVSAVHSFPLVLVGRVLQGLGGGTFPLATSILRDVYPAAKLRGAIAAFSVTVSVGSIFGLLLAAVLTDATDGSAAVFWTTAAFTVAALVAGWVWIPRDARAGRGRVDIPGAVLLSAWLVTLLIPLSEGGSWGWTSGRVLGLLGTTVVLFVLWVLVEQRVDDPLVDMAVFAERSVLSTNLASVLIGFGMFGSFIGVIGFVQADPATLGYGFAVTLVGASLFLVPGSLGQLGAPWLVTRLARRFDGRAPCAVGGLCAGTGLLLLAGFNDHRWQVYVALLVNSVGAGMAFSGFPGRIVEAVVQEQTGIATGMNSIMRQIGASIGAAVVTSLLVASATAGGPPAESGYVNGFLLGGALAFVGAALLYAGPAVAPGRRAAALEEADAVGAPVAT
jgi:MFS family permease